ncbi:hypothetical protein M595_4481 [Lyngbya aestuarii BL J]|uniref:Uncharacterized protein n=1 Tax=Lyngbya aestuarii BL J TaxID=1348334 RepID=U7QCG9_9CYAN|nr:hypothetical protein M595_4481 [Lyngbya aestuarii BL J]
MTPCKPPKQKLRKRRFLVPYSSRTTVSAVTFGVSLAKAQGESSYVMLTRLFNR